MKWFLQASGPATRLIVSEGPGGLTTEMQEWRRGDSSGSWETVEDSSPSGDRLLREVLGFISEEVNLLNRELRELRLSLPLSNEDFWRVINVEGTSFSSNSFDCQGLPELCFTTAEADYPGCRLTPSRSSVRQLFGGRSTFDKEVAEELVRLVEAYA